MTSAPTAPANAGSALAARLAELKQRTDALTGAQQAKPNALSERLAGITQQVNQASGLSDPAERAAQLGLAQANFNQVRAMITKEQADAGELVVTLDEMFHGLTAEHAQLLQPNAAEKQEIADAEAAVTDAETKAADKGFFSRWNAGARQQAVTDAKAALKETHIRVRRQMRDRLRNAKTEQSMQEIITITQRLKDLTESRVITTQQQLELATQFRQQRQDDIVTLSRESDELEGLKTKTEQDVKAQELKVKDTPGGSEARAQAERELSDLKAGLSEIENRRNVLLARIRTTQTFAKEHEQEENTLRDNRAAQDLYIAGLQIIIENRQQTVAAMMELERGFADIEASATIMEVSDKVSERQMSRAAVISAAVKNQIATSVETMPEKLARLEEIAKEHEKSSLEYARRMQAAYEKLKQEGALEQAA